MGAPDAQCKGKVTRNRRLERVVPAAYAAQPDLTGSPARPTSAVRLRGPTSPAAPARPDLFDIIRPDADSTGETQ